MKEKLQSSAFSVSGGASCRRTEEYGVWRRWHAGHRPAWKGGLGVQAAPNKVASSSCLGGRRLRPHPCEAAGP